MSRSPIRANEVLKPEKILANIINDYVGGRLDNANVLYRVLVTKIDLKGRSTRRTRF